MEVQRTIKIFDDFGNEILSDSIMKVKMKNGEMYIGFFIEPKVMYSAFKFAYLNDVETDLYYHDIDSVIKTEK